MRDIIEEFGRGFGVVFQNNRIWQAAFDNRLVDFMVRQRARKFAIRHIAVHVLFRGSTVYQSLVLGRQTTTPVDAEPKLVTQTKSLELFEQALTPLFRALQCQYENMWRTMNLTTPMLQRRNLRFKHPSEAKFFGIAIGNQGSSRNERSSGKQILLDFFKSKLERAMRFELTTFTLAR